MTTILNGKANEVYPEAVRNLLLYGKRVPSRVADTLELHPAMLEIVKPKQRLITSYGRAVNPAFALAEVLWIFCGQDDVETLEFYNSKIGDYSDDGQRFNAAYGARLRRSFGHDQLKDIIDTLQHDQGSRQAILSIWHPQYDRGWEQSTSDLSTDDQSAIKVTVSTPRATKDRACNVTSHVMIRDGRLDWVQFMRSNDVIWGTPNNFMQWLHIMEFVANQVGVKMGTYYHFADSLHMYDYHQDEAQAIKPFDLYKELGYRHREFGEMKYLDQIKWAASAESMIRSQENYEMLDELLFSDRIEDNCGPYFKDVLQILLAWKYYKNRQDAEAYEVLLRCNDLVLSAAQMRYFYYWRWHNNPVLIDAIANLIQAGKYPKRVVQWIMDATVEFNKKEQ